MERRLWEKINIPYQERAKYRHIQIIFLIWEIISASPFISADTRITTAEPFNLHFDFCEIWDIAWNVNSSERNVIERPPKTPSARFHYIQTHL